MAAPYRDLPAVGEALDSWAVRNKLPIGDAIDLVLNDQDVRRAYYEELPKPPFTYAGYLRSQAWREFRREVFLMRGRRCERCGSKSNLELHHLTYSRLGHEDYGDVEILCGKCHPEADVERQMGSGKMARIDDEALRRQVLRDFLGMGPPCF